MNAVYKEMYEQTQEPVVAAVLCLAHEMSRVADALHNLGSNGATGDGVGGVVELVAQEIRDGFASLAGSVDSLGSSLS